MAKINRGGVEKAGYQIGAFASQVSAGWHREKFAPGVYRPSPQANLDERSPRYQVHQLR